MSKQEFNIHNWRFKQAIKEAEEEETVEKEEETEEVETEEESEEVADDDESRVPYNRLYKLLSKGLGKSFTELYPTPDYFFDIASQLFK
tara:strand:- start:237 stop:503 length:267 start_codon:yes stop_codon:yes gene_type:complete